MAVYHTIVCEQCGAEAELTSGHINRARKNGKRLFCGLECSGMARRTSQEKKKARKAEYDRNRREKLGDQIRAAKAEAYKRNFDRDKEREIRKKRMPGHVEYCRRPEYREYKSEYDKKRTDKEYGEYAECARLLNELKAEIIRQVPDRYERQKGRGLLERLRQKKEQKRLAKTQ